MYLRLLIVCLTLAIVPRQSLACRYTVRDIGFANLRNHEYAIVLSWKTTDEESQNNELAQSADTLSQALKAHLTGSNTTVMIDQGRFAQGVSDHSTNATNATTAIPHAKTADDGVNRIRIELLDRLGRATTLAELDPASAASLDMAAWLEQSLFLSVLDQLNREALQSFAHLLIVEGSDAGVNQEVHNIANQAMAAIQRLEPLLPRPIAFPLRNAVLDKNQTEQQQVLRWLLGSQDTSLTLLAVVYGRGRMAGTVMQGPSVSLQEVLAQLALVGQSCECETDRAWLEEKSLPFRWDTETRGQASSFLGFDPDSPLVRAEMLRIVSQGAKQPRKENGSSDANSPDAIARMLLGYSETQLQDSKKSSSLPEDAESNQLQSSSSNAAPVETLGKPAGVQSTVIAGDGWDFEPEVAAINVNEHDSDFNLANQTDGLGQGSNPLPDTSKQPAEPTDESVSESKLNGEYSLHSIHWITLLTLASLLGMSLLVVFIFILRSK